MPKTIVLDTGVLGMLGYSRASAEAEACREWLRFQLDSGNVFVIPEIADFELRRELLRLKHTSGLLRLESLLTVPGCSYLPISTNHMRLAAQLWAEVRREGKPTAHPHALDGDVILAGQAMSLTEADLVVATTNVDHIARFVPAAPWQTILS